jgi:hypothetical protein
VCSSDLVIGYLATGSQLKGKAKSYNSHYDRSLSNFMNRVATAIHRNSPYYLLTGKVGPNGAFGYYIIVD